MYSFLHRLALASLSVDVFNILILDAVVNHLKGKDRSLNIGEFRCAIRWAESTSLLEYVTRRGLPTDEVALSTAKKRKELPLSSVSSVTILEPAPDTASGSQLDAGRSVEWSGRVETCGGPRWSLTSMDPKRASVTTYTMNQSTILEAFEDVEPLDVLCVQSMFLASIPTIVVGALSVLRPTGFMLTLEDSVGPFFSWIRDTGLEDHVDWFDCTFDLGSGDLPLHWPILRPTRSADRVVAETKGKLETLEELRRSKLLAYTRAGQQLRMFATFRDWRPRQQQFMSQAVLQGGHGKELLNLVIAHPLALHLTAQHSVREFSCTDGRGLVELLGAAPKLLPEIQRSVFAACGEGPDRMYRSAAERYSLSIGHLSASGTEEAVAFEVAWALELLRTAVNLALLCVYNQALARIEAPVKLWEPVFAPTVTGVPAASSHAYRVTLETLLRSVRRRGDARRRLRFWEVGVANGELSNYLLHALPWLDVTGVDAWFEVYHWYRATGDWTSTAQGQWASYSRAASKYQQMGRRASLWRLESATAACVLAPMFDLDVVFIDAAHSYAGVMLDLDLWAPVVERNCGLLVGHDWEWGLGFPDGPSVATAATVWHERWQAQRNYTLPSFTVGPGGVWWVDFSLTSHCGGK